MRVTVLAVAAALTLTVATGCADKPKHRDGTAAPAGSPAPSTSASAAPVEAPVGTVGSSTPPTGTPTSNGTTGATAPTACRVNQLAADIEQFIPPGKAGSSQDARVKLVNGGNRCTVSGYIGLQLFAGQEPRETKVTRINGAQETVTLDRGASAWVRIAWNFQPLPDEQGPEPVCEPRPTAAAVTLPGQTDPIRVNEEFGRVCWHGEVYVGPLTATRPS
jgi:hypothetical protein